uniref:hypothetical protein n=1 Tax=Tessaracoccus sp. TaxID=1971211 RepID=UPI0026129473|nr:hypothetical protein [Tessaracoccus sp.]
MSTTMKERLQAAVTAAEKYGDDLDAKGVSPSGDDLAHLTALLGEVKDAKKALESDAEAKGALADAKAFMSQLAGTGPDTSSGKQHVGSIALPSRHQVKTFGQAFVESPAYDAFVKQYARNGVIPDSIKGLQSGTFGADMKALITGVSDTSAGAAIVNDEYGQIVDLVGARELTMRDIVTTSTTDSDAVDYVRVTSKTNSAAPVAGPPRPTRRPRPALRVLSSSLPAAGTSRSPGWTSRSSRPPSRRSRTGCRSRSGPRPMRVRSAP